MIKSGLKENFKSSIVAATGSTGHSAARRGEKKLLRKRAKNTVFLTIFGIFDRDPLRPGTKRRH